MKFLFAKDIIMDVPRTTSGSPCKICKQKGSPCHIHKGKSLSKMSESSRKSSLNSLSPKKTSLEFPYFLDLPKPVLYETLLNLKPRELKILCSESRKVHSICILEEFKRLYDIRHKISSFTLGRLQKNDGTRMTIVGSNGINMLVFIGKVTRLTNELSVFVRQEKHDIRIQFMVLFEENFITEFTIFDEHSGFEFTWIMKNDKLIEAKPIKSSEKKKEKLLKSLEILFFLRKKLEWMPYEEDGEIKIFRKNSLKLLKLF